MRIIECNESIEVTLREASEVAHYRYRASISHNGTSPDNGHYVAYKVGRNESFYRMSDVSVLNIKDKQMFVSQALFGGGINNETPYVLLYERTS